MIATKPPLKFLYTSVVDTKLLPTDALVITPVLLTSNVRMQVALGARVPPDRFTWVAPAVGVNVPPHVLVEFGVGATSRPVPMNDEVRRPVSGVDGFGLLNVTVTVEMPVVTVMLASDAVVTTFGAAVTVPVPLVGTVSVGLPPLLVTVNMPVTTPAIVGVKSSVGPQIAPGFNTGPHPPTLPAKGGVAL